MKTLLLTLLFAVISLNSFGQDSTRFEKPFMNTIRYNISNPAIFGIKNVIIGYERVLSNNQTFSVDFGVNRLPIFSPQTFEDEDVTLSLRRTDNNSGFHFSFDYRFYLKSENKFDAPRGVYIGPYYSYNTFNKNIDWDLTGNDGTSEIGTNLSLNIHTIGAQLGYQFLLSKRVALDFILLGPGLGRYSAIIEEESNLSPEDQALLFETINNLLAERIPGFNTVLDGSGFQKSGSFNISAPGYRLMINLGIRF